MAGKSNSSSDLPVLPFAELKDWAVWLHDMHAQSNGLWLKLAKKKSGIPSITYDEALEVALCYGWIDSQKKGYDEQWWLQKFSPRRPTSIWSMRNREKIEQLAAAGKMQPAGWRAVEEAKANGQWEAAYDSPGSMVIPDDFQEALEANREAKAFFDALDSRNRFAILHRIQTAKKLDTRQNRIRQFIEMLTKNEKLYP
jgi:uncharacterized protein YdeI (YjbR/CyaY-like superfamily)